MALELRTARNEWLEGVHGSFWDADNILFLDLGAGYAVSGKRIVIQLIIHWRHVRLLVSVLSMNTQSWFPLGLTGLLSFQCKELSREGGVSCSHRLAGKHQKCPKALLAPKEAELGWWFSKGTGKQCEQRLKKKTQPGPARKDQMLSLNRCHVEISHLKNS